VGLGLEQQLRGLERSLGDGGFFRFPAGADQRTGTASCAGPALISDYAG
jgi:hypothetical protein